MAKNVPDYYCEYLERFENFSDQDIIKASSSEVGNSAWGTARSGYLSALRHEFKRRDIDISSISSDDAISIQRRVSLYVIDEKRVVLPID